MKLSTIALTLAAAALCFGGAEPNPVGPAPVIQVSHEAIKEGKSAAHEKVEADWARTFRSAKFPYHWLGMTPMNGASEAWFVSSYQSFAEMERSDAQESPALRSAAELLEARDGELRAGSSTQIAVYRKDLSYRADQMNIAKARFAMIGVYRVKLGHLAEFLAGNKLFLAAMAKSNYPLPIVCYESVTGPQGVFSFFTPMESLASLDSMEMYDQKLAEAMGAAKMDQLMKEQGGLFDSIERTFLRISPKMSYVSEETEKVDPGFWRPKPVATPAPKPAAAPKPAEK